MPISVINNDSIADTAVHGRRNLIINGAMNVAQRAVSASAGNGLYVSLDRYMTSVNGGGAYTLSQETDTPSGQGFKNSMKLTVNTADSSIAAGDYYIVQHRIEGQNVSHLMLGTSDAVKVTLSFWVKSSLTGNFGGAFANGTPDRSYPFQYNISTANTWQKITKTIQLDTSGTWLTTNGIGLKIMFDFGSGTTFQGASDAWASANYHTATSSVQLIGTGSATWYITGVQLEVGETATPFEHRSYGEELKLCKRYYTQGTSDEAGTTRRRYANLFSGIHYGGSFFYETEMRTDATVTLSGFTFTGATAIAVAFSKKTGFVLQMTAPAGTYYANSGAGTWTANAEL